MTLILQLLINYYRQIIVTIGIFSTYFLFRNNEKLKHENKDIKVDSLQKIHIINLQKDVIKKLKTTKSTNINGTIKRMLDKDL